MRPDADPPAGSAASWRRRLASFVEFRPREAMALGVACLALVAGAAFAYARSLPSGGAKPLATPVAEPSPTSSPTSAGIVVNVAGAVVSPGVYTLPAGARVIDGIRAAGGAAPGADVASINLARPLTDGERVYIPRKGETPPPEAATGGAGGTGGGSSGSSNGKVNINTASESELEALPGIGQVLAQRIVDYRTQHGPFHDVKDLLKVEGIGEKKFDSLKDYVTV
jgi:competence protein ComEA